MGPEPLVEVRNWKNPRECYLAMTSFPLSPPSPSRPPNWLNSTRSWRAKAYGPSQAERAGVSTTFGGSASFTWDQKAEGVWRQTEFFLLECHLCESSALAAVSRQQRLHIRLRQFCVTALHSFSVPLWSLQNRLTSPYCVAKSSVGCLILQ